MGGLRTILLAVIVASCATRSESSNPSDSAVDVSHDAVSATASGASLELDLGAGEEATECVSVRLSNEAGFIVRSSSELSGGAHHLLVYRSNESAPSGPTRCSPLGGALSGKEQLIGVGAKAQSTIELPRDVGIRIDKNQMVKLEAHIFNASKEKQRVRVAWTFDMTTDARIAADAFVWGTARLRIPATSAWDTGVKFQAGLPATKIGIVTTHQHRLGTKFTLWASKTSLDTSAAPIVDETNPLDAAIHLLDPRLAMDGANGISYRCEYNNATDSAVMFGTSYNEEMCFLIGWYYPGKGTTDVCIDNTCLQRTAP